MQKKVICNFFSTPCILHFEATTHIEGRYHILSWSTEPTYISWKIAQHLFTLAHWKFITNLSIRVKFSKIWKNDS